MFDAWLAELKTLDVSGCARPELADWAAASGRLRAALDAFDARVAAAVDGLGDGGAPASTVLRSAGRCSQREADRRAKRASGLAGLPAAANALAAGAITAEHADGLVRAAEATSAEAVAESGLLDAASRRPADLHAKDIRDWTRRHQSQVSLEQAQARRFAARRCVIFDNDDGMTVLHAEFDPVTGAEVKAAMTRATDRLYHTDGGRDAADTVRSVEQRRADALAEILSGTGVPTSAGTGLATPRRAPVRSQMIVLIEADGTADIPGVGPIPATEVAKLSCTSEFFGLVVDTDGQPLWHGTSVRLADDNQWRALIARDGGCVICDAHPSKCEAHHIVFAGPPTFGATDIVNLVLLCAHHHHLIHDLGYRLEQRADRTWVLVAPDQPRAGP